MMTPGIESGGEELRVSGPRGKALGPGKAEVSLGLGREALGRQGPKNKGGRHRCLPPLSFPWP